MDSESSLTASDESPRVAAVRRLLERAHIAAADFTINPLPGGDNNRVHRMDVAGGRYLLKEYFRHPHDGRDRLKVEYDFTAFAWQHGLRQVPQPLACDTDAGLGLYELIQGRRLKPGEVDDAAIAQALAFYRELNGHRHLAEAHALSDASEACFSLADHLACVERRLAGFLAARPRDDGDAEAAKFVHAEVWPRFREVQAQVEAAALRLGLSMSHPLPAESRRLSPSDFGFHNALVEPGGKLRFLDFEYAGWDAPTKLVCDLFCQPAVPVPERFWTRVVDEVTADLPDPALERCRIELLLPVYRIKWITIMLNDFQTAGDERRRFARPDADSQQRKAEQLCKARASLAAI